MKPPHKLVIAPEGRLFIILKALERRAIHTSEIYMLARNPNAEKPGRERGKTMGALIILRDANLIVWSANFASITEAGRRVLADLEGEAW